jgi:mono/diheme cytochrome c family protein
MKVYLLSFVLLFLIFSCQNKPNNKQNPLASISDPKVMQLAIPGKVLYDNYCANCHQESGEGLGKLIPPLNPSDYMSEDLKRTTRLIKYGMEGEIIVNGITYNQKMPALDYLTDLEIAQITTYLYNIWGNKKGVIRAKDVNEYLK